MATAVLHVKAAEEPRAARALAERPDLLDAGVEYVLLDGASTRVGIACDLARKGSGELARRVCDQLASVEPLDLGGAPTGGADA